MDGMDIYWYIYIYTLFEYGYINIYKRIHILIYDKCMYIMGLLCSLYYLIREKSTKSWGFKIHWIHCFSPYIYLPNRDHVIGIFKIEESESFCRACRRILKFSVGNSKQPWVKKNHFQQEPCFPSFKNPFICQVLIAGALRYTWMQRWASWLFQFVFDLYYYSDSLFEKKQKTASHT